MIYLIIAYYIYSDTIYLNINFISYISFICKFYFNTTLRLIYF